MADTNVSRTRSDISTREREQNRSLSRRNEYTQPLWAFGGDLFSLSPFALMRRMNDEMDRIFGNSYGAGSFGEGAGGSMWSPALEVKQRDNNLIVCAELPGINKDDVRVEVTEGALVIEGERKREHEETQGGFHRTERSYGRFYRTVPLPEGAKTENARAEFHNGVLEVTMPVEAPQSNRRQIPVSEGAGRRQEAGGAAHSSPGVASQSSQAGSASSGSGAGKINVENK